MVRTYMKVERGGYKAIAMHHATAGAVA